MSDVYEVWSYFMSNGPTVEGEYDNEQDARDAAETYADGTWRSEVVRKVAEDKYEVVWQSEEDGDD